MLCRDLTVTNLSITEDYYEYKATFRLCSQDRWIDIDLSDSNDRDFESIKNFFGLDETADVVRTEIMNKVIEVAKLESRNEEGKKN